MFFIGCACKFLYGPETEEEKKKQVERALEEKSELKLEVKFYKKNGNNNEIVTRNSKLKLFVLSGPSFWCLLDIVPIKNEKREVVLFLASHKDISDTKVYAGVNRLPLPGFEPDQKALGMDGGLLGDPDYGSDPESCDITGNHLDVEAPSNYNYGRRRSRAVLYQLSGHYKTDKSKKIHSKLNTNVSHHH